MSQDKDIVERLRSDGLTSDCSEAIELCHEAADEIERLREYVSYLEAALVLHDRAAKDRAALGQRGCVYETRIYTPQHHRLTINSEARSWCRTHGWDCPNVGQERGKETFFGMETPDNIK